MLTKEYLLENGLKLIAREIHHAPLAAFYVWYRVGGRNEVPGITGISHWVEHMMFKGTPKYGKGQLDRVISRHGGIWNGFTWIDFTAYFEVLPVAHFDLALDIESDRMVNCIFDPKEVQSERTVIISEREGAENDPEFWLDEAVTRIAYLVHPYGQGVIGAKSDLLAITRDDLYQHYKTYYSPDNAVAIAVGDFDADEVYEKVKKYFGDIPKGPARPKVRSVEPPQEGERRVLVRRPGGTIYGEFAYHIPDAADPEFYPVIVLDAVLSGGKALAAWGGTRGMGKSARLYKALVEKEIAVSASSSIEPCIDPGLLKISLTLRHGVSSEKAEKAVIEVLDKLMQEKVPSQELERVKKQLKAQMAYSQEGVQNNGMALGLFEMVSSWKEADLVSEKIDAVSAEDVLRVAQKFLDGKNRTVGWFIPEDGRDSGGGGISDDFGLKGGKTHHGVRYYFYSGGSNRVMDETNLPGPKEIKRVELANGLVLLGYKNPAVNFTTSVVSVDAGAYACPLEKAGLAYITNLCLLRGTSKRSAEEINEFTDSLGMSLEAEAGRDTAHLSITSLTEDAEKAFELLGEILMQPSFPAREVEKIKGEHLTLLRANEKDTQVTCDRLFSEMVYPKTHPYHGWYLGYEDTVKNLTKEDLESFYRRFYSPNKVIIGVVSNLEQDKVFAMLEKVFGGWGSQPRRENDDQEILKRRLAKVFGPKGRLENFRYIPGKTQCDVALGFPCMSRTNPDYQKFFVANMILGRLGLGGRIGRNVRDEQGLAYYVYSGLMETKGQGAWVIRAGVNPRGVEKAVCAILSEIRKFQQEVCTDDEIEEVKGYLAGRLPLSVELSRSMAAMMVKMEYFGLGLDYLQKYTSTIRSVSKEDVLEMARKYLSADDYVLVVTGPKFK